MGHRAKPDVQDCARFHDARRGVLPGCDEMRVRHRSGFQGDVAGAAVPGMDHAAPIHLPVGTPPFRAAVPCTAVLHALPKLLRVLFALDAGTNPADAQPVTLFTTDPDVASETVYRIARDRVHCECTFRDAKQYPGPTAWRAPSEPPSCIRGSRFQPRYCTFGISGVDRPAASPRNPASLPVPACGSSQP